MARADRLKRQRAVLWLLEDSPEGMTTAELGQKLEISERTMRRDLAALRAAGYPLTSSANHWRFVEGQALPSALASDGAGEVAEHDKVMALDSAVRARRPLRVRYSTPRDPGSAVRIRLAPRALRYVDGSLFLVAREHPRGRMRSLAVERLTAVERLKGKAKKEPDGVLERYLDTTLRGDANKELIRVTVSFDPAAAWRVEERIWHPSQRVHLQKDGSALVALRLAGFAWVRAWVLGFGAEATVLDPPELIQLVCADLDVARERYCGIAERVAQLDLFRLGK